MAAADQTNPVAACANSGSNFLVTYRDNADSAFYARLVPAADGGSVGTSFAVSAASSVSGEVVSIVAWGKDRYLVTWIDSRNSATTGNDVYGQYINVSGSTVGDNFAVNAASESQVYPAVAGNTSAGSFLATWHYPTNGGAAYALSASLIDPFALNGSSPIGGGSGSGGHRCLIASVPGSSSLLAGLLSGLLMLAGFKRR